jgi:hypothetical protein
MALALPSYRPVDAVSDTTICCGLAKKKDYFFLIINICVGDEMAYSINQQLSYFLKKQGLTISALDTHPHIDDVILLTRIRQSLWHLCSREERQYLNDLWHLVYIEHHGLIKRHIDRLDKLIQNKIHIQAKLATKANKRDDDNRGKTSLTTQMVYSI